MVTTSGVSPRPASLRSSRSLQAASAPARITTGPDGNLWFTETNGNNIGRITTAGVVTEFPIPTVGSDPVGITVGPDGNLWFTEAVAGNIGKVSDFSGHIWQAPAYDLFHGTELLQWAAVDADPTTKVDVIAIGNATYSIGTNLMSIGEIDWDTTKVPDGRYELRLILRDELGHVLAEVPRTIAVNNSVIWHTGTIATSETWTADKVHVIEGVVIPSGVTVTIEPGTVVKAQPNSQIIVSSGGILNALGTDAGHIVLTSVLDDTGGDTNLDGSLTKPLPGAWFGIFVQGSGRLNINTDTELRYNLAVRSGPLSASETWLGTYLYHITGDVVIPSGVTLTIQPGAVIKFDQYRGIIVKPGGQLIAEGTVAQPIYFTSIKDDSVGGDTNGDGNATSPAVGDWHRIYINGGTASFNHVQLLYGGSPGNDGGETGVILVDGSASVTISNIIMRQSLSDGVHVTGVPVNIYSSVFTGLDRAVAARLGSTVNVINCTVDNNRVGLVVDWGTLNAVNTIVTNSAEFGVQYYTGTGNVRYSDVWSSTGVNYGYISDLTGTNGNISVDPLYKNQQQGDYRLNYGSPCIDAADGTITPATDFMDASRYTDPRTTTKRGIQTSTGAYADIGAVEFVETAASNIDFIVSSVSGPVSAMVGNQVQISWIDTNIGTGAAKGPWHDAIYLVRDPDTNPVEIFTGEILVGQNVMLGPSESFKASGTIRVPGSIVGNHRWEVKTNSRGDIFEGQNTGNNTGVSQATVAIDLPELTVDGPALSNQFTSVGQSYWYKIIPGSGNDVELNLNLSGNTGTTQVYIGQGYVPDSQHFDSHSHEWNSPNSSAPIPNTSAQTYYVTAYAGSLSSSTANFTISAVTLNFGLSGVSPSTIGNAGPVTLDLHGGQLQGTFTYEIVDSNGTAYVSTTNTVIDSTEVLATFDTTGLASGIYDVRVNNGVATAALAHSVTVVNGGGGNISASIVGPSRLRIGRPSQYQIVYSNTGLCDGVASIAISFLGLTTNNATISLGPEFPALPSDMPSPNAGRRFLQLSDGIVTTSLIITGLRPGESGTVSFSLVVNDDTPFEIDLIQWPTGPIGIDPSGLQSQALHMTKTMMNSTVHIQNDSTAVEVTYTIPPESDIPALQDAVNVMNADASAGNTIRWRVNHGGCGGHADQLKDAIVQAASSGDAYNLNGWSIRAVERYGWYDSNSNPPALPTGINGHSVLLLTSPDGYRNYIFDNYDGTPCISPMIHVKGSNGQEGWSTEDSAWVRAHQGAKTPGSSFAGWDMFFAAAGIGREGITIGEFGQLWTERNFALGRTLTVLGPPHLPAPVQSCPVKPPVASLPGKGAGAIDPNGKMGITGVGPQGFVASGQAFAYIVFFENQASATLPAQQVVVTDELDANLDWSTLQIQQIGFNNVTVPVPSGLQSFTTSVYVTTDPSPVQVTASLNPANGLLTWTMQSVDPVTGGVPADPLAGFLPPNDATNRGDGYVSFTVMPKKGLANGTTITNQASIVFDVNAPIATNTVINTIDSAIPTSTVASLPTISSTPSFTVSWGGNDPGGAGIAYYDIYVSTDGGPFTVWLAGTTQTSATFDGADGYTYSFFSVATDNIGNRQNAPAGAQASTTTATIPGAPTGLTAVAGNAQATVSFTAPASDGGSAITSYTVTSSPGSITASGASSRITIPGLTNGTAYTFTVTATNAIGTGPASAPSNSVTPTSPPISVNLSNGITLIASNLSGCSDTKVNAPSSAPAGYNFVGSIYNITCATYTGPITVTISYNQSLVPYGKEGTLRMFHWNGSSWNYVPSSVDTTNHTITGQVNSLSPFGIGYYSSSGGGTGGGGTGGGGTYTTGANEDMIALITILAISAGVFILRKNRWLRKV